MKTISLNSAKTLSGAFQDLNYEKLEIAVKLNQQPQKYEGDIDFMNLVPKPQLNNSTLSLNFSYAKSQTQLVVSLFGPTESRISSKQHPDRAFIELTIKDTTSKDSNMLADQNSYEDLRSTLRNLLEQVIQLNAYPKSIISFQVFVVKDETLGVQLFSACFNGLLSVVQQAGITLKNSPVVALTIGIKEKEMGDNFQIEYMSDFSHEQVKAINAESSDIQIIDLMVQNKLDIGFMRTRGSTLPMSLIIASQESKKEFEKIIKAQSKLIRKQFLNQ
eukprot:403356928